VKYKNWELELRKWHTIQIFKKYCFRENLGAKEGPGTGPRFIEAPFGEGGSRLGELRQAREPITFLRGVSRLALELLYRLF